MGGLPLYITGSGFTRNDLITVGICPLNCTNCLTCINCPINNNLTTDSTILCTVPPSPQDTSGMYVSGQYNVQVQVNTVTASPTTFSI